MEQQTQEQPVVQQAAAPAPVKKSNIWLWLIGGCLTIVILIGVAVVGLGWWAASKVKKAIKENQPKLEQLQKDAEGWQKSAEDMQKKADKWQESIPEPDDLQVPSDL